MIPHKNISLNYKILISYGSYIITGLILYFTLYIFNQYHYSIEFISIFAGIYITLTGGIINAYFNHYWTNKLKQIETKHSKQLTLLRHDVKGLLTPALLMSDRILLNHSADEKIIQSAEHIAEAIEKTADYLNKTKE